MFIWDFVASLVLTEIFDWFYDQVVGFLGDFFAQIGGMGVELFELEWVQAVVLFFNKLGWALFAVSLVVAAFEYGLEATSGRGNLRQTAINALKGFFAVSLFSTLPVRLYALSVSLQGTFAAGLSGKATSIGSLGSSILDSLSDTPLSEFAGKSLFGLASLTSPILLLFCIMLMQRPTAPHPGQRSFVRLTWPKDCSTNRSSEKDIKFSLPISALTAIMFLFHLWV